MTEPTGPGAAKPYAAFISYSHAADGQFAPALQRGMQRLAKHWRQRRALEVFRDETGLAVNPDLWRSIVTALDASEWFVLLASPLAAGSTWVGQEIEHCARTKGTDRIVVVVTDGRLAWDAEAGDFTADSTAAHPALRGLFDAPPRQVDMSWAKGDTDLTLRNSRFREQVAEIVAPMRGLSTHDLVAEDARQQRRTGRVVRFAVASLVVLALGATAASVAAVANQREAAQERAVAEDQQAVAEREARAAISRELAALSRALGEEYATAYDEAGVQTPTDPPVDPTVPLLLAAQAQAVAATPEAEAALLTAVTRTGTQAGLVTPPPGVTDGVVPAVAATGSVAVWPDGSRVLTDDGELRAADGTTVATGLPAAHGAVAFDPAGAHAAYVVDTGTAGSASPSVLAVVDLTSGDLRTLPASSSWCGVPCLPGALALAPDAQALMVRPHTVSGRNPLGDDGSPLIRVELDGDRAVETWRLDLAGPGFVRYVDAGDAVQASDGAFVHRLDPDTLEAVGTPRSVLGVDRWSFLTDDRVLVQTSACDAGLVDGVTFSLQATIPVGAQFYEGGACDGGLAWWVDAGQAVLVETAAYCDHEAEGCLARWPVEAEALRAMACEAVGRDWTAQERETYLLGRDDPPPCAAREGGTDDTSVDASGSRLEVSR